MKGALCLSLRASPRVRLWGTKHRVKAQLYVSYRKCPSVGKASLYTHHLASHHPRQLNLFAQLPFCMPWNGCHICPCCCEVVVMWKWKGVSALGVCASLPPAAANAHFLFWNLGKYCFSKNMKPSCLLRLLTKLLLFVLMIRINNMIS